MAKGVQTGHGQGHILAKSKSFALCGPDAENVERLVDLPIYVLLPVYNGARTLRRTLHNLFQQSYRDFRILAYDDGSTDQTGEILRQTASRDSRLRIITGAQNIGRGAARNRLLHEARGGAVAWQDADDTWAPSKLSEQIVFLEGLRAEGHSIEKQVILSTFSRHVTRKGQLEISSHIPPERFDARYLLGDDYPRCPFQLQATFGLASSFIDCGGFDDTLNWGEDQDMAFRLISRGHEIVSHRVDHALAMYHHSLAAEKGDYIAAAQTVLAARYNDFARAHEVDLEKLFNKRRLNYLFGVYLNSENFNKAIFVMLKAILDVDEDQLNIAARNLTAVIRGMIRAEIKNAATEN